MSTTTAAHRVILDADPFVTRGPGDWRSHAHWPGRWVGPETPPAPPVVLGYRLRFSLDEATTVRLHVTADERYALHLDGELLDRGPDRGDPEHWTFATLDVPLQAGDHLLAAAVWSLGDDAPYAQLSARTGLLLVAEDHPELTTGTGAWEVAELPGHGWAPAGAGWGCGVRTDLDGRRYPWGWEDGTDDLDWRPAVAGEQARDRTYANEVLLPAHLLVPTVIPAQTRQTVSGGAVRHLADGPAEGTATVPVLAAHHLADEAAAWAGLVDGTASVTVPAQTTRKVIIDLEQYVCCYPRLHLSGGRDATVRVHWQEALLQTDGRKGDRDTVEGKLFTSPGAHGAAGAVLDGVGDRFTAGGGDEVHSTLWWEAGRYVEVVVVTADEPLTLRRLELVEERYPYEDRSAFSCDDSRIDGVRTIAFRTLQMCSHETTMDCPYFEQLQYAGDTRLQLLAAYVSTGDDRLARQALLAFDASRDASGLTRSRYPSRVRQTIPPFSLWWVASVHDFAAWRGDLDFVRTLMPGVRGVLDAHGAALDAEGLLQSLPGWNFTDWVDGWVGGCPPDASWGVSGVLQLQLALVARLAAELEEWLDEPGLAARDHALADRVRDAAERHFWSTEQGLYADDLGHRHWSEHAQALAVLAGAEHGVAAVEATIGRTDLDRTTVYFDHYLFEALATIDRTDVLLDRMALWFGLLDQGLRTVVEQPEPTRSDCHAWGAHPIFHLYASLLGVRPTAPGMAEVMITPRLGPWSSADGTLCTPHGPLRVVVDPSGTRVELPDGIRQVV